MEVMEGTAPALKGFYFFDLFQYSTISSINSTITNICCIDSHVGQSEFRVENYHFI